MKKKKINTSAGRRPRAVGRPSGNSSTRRSKKRRFVLIGTCCLMVLLVTATIAGPWTSSLGTQRIQALFFSPPPLPSPSNPSKEYIYGGGRLIATEEPFPLVAPASLVASTVSSLHVSISWSVSPNAHHYQVERASNFGSTFTVLNSNVAGTSFNDNSVTAVNAYLYRVKAADAAGNLSGPSNVDLATAITFDDDPFPAPLAQTVAKAQHLVQLRQAVNAARAAANLSAATWTQNPVQQNVSLIKANDVQELRTALDQALSVFGLATGGYTDSPLAGVIKKIHIQELRDRVK